MTEIWKDVQDFKGLYQVSDYGNVRSLDRVIINKNGKPQKYPGKALKPFWQQIGQVSYGRVTLSKDHERFDCLVHRIVGQMFLPPDPDRPFINHIDNNPQNNHISNLERCTHSENMVHAQKQGRLFNAQSAGGKAGGKVNKDKMLAKFSPLRGNQVNSWTVLDEDLAFQRGKKYYANCTCKCGKSQAIELGRLIRKEVTACKSCNSRWRNK